MHLKGALKSELFTISRNWLVLGSANRPRKGERVSWEVGKAGVGGSGGGEMETIVLEQQFKKREGKQTKSKVLCVKV